MSATVIVLLLNSIHHKLESQNKIGKMMKFLVLAFFAVLAIAKANEFCAGCVTTVTDDKGLERATNTLNNSLKKLAAGEGPHYK